MPEGLLVGCDAECLNNHHRRREFQRICLFSSRRFGETGWLGDVDIKNILLTIKALLSPVLNALRGIQKLFDPGGSVDESTITFLHSYPVVPQPLCGAVFW
jgi:hypothetical protein